MELERRPPDPRKTIFLCKGVLLVSFHDSWREGIGVWYCADGLSVSQKLQAERCQCSILNQWHDVERCVFGARSYLWTCAARIFLSMGSSKSRGCHCWFIRQVRFDQHPMCSPRLFRTFMIPFLGAWMSWTEVRKFRHGLPDTGHPSKSARSRRS